MSHIPVNEEHDTDACEVIRSGARTTLPPAYLAGGGVNVRHCLAVEADGEFPSRRPEAKEFCRRTRDDQDQASR